MPLVDILYTTVAHATGDGRNGHVTTDDGQLDFDVRIPTSMGGPGGATNPEQLFACGYAACFHSAVKVVAKRAGANVDESEVSATVSIGTLEGGAFGLAVELDVHIPGVDDATAQQLADAAHQVCPYSNATRGNIDVKLSVV